MNQAGKHDPHAVGVHNEINQSINKHDPNIKQRLTTDN